MDTNCPLCKAIATEPEEEGDIQAYQGSIRFEILKCKEQKGHSHRYMIVTQEHVSHVSPYEEATAKAFLFRYMLLRKDTVVGRSDVQSKPFDFYILERTHASIKDHWHCVACDCYTGNDFDKIEDTDRIMTVFVKQGEVFPE